jgi:hypothetical protein
MEKPCLLLTHCKKQNHEFAIGKTTSFYGVNAMLLIGEIGREKEKTIITRRNYHCEQ